ncbi:3-octaprenyl-4-hydroxybenzoate carboxy-lyase [Fusarium bulbicola]|nr:3-octaprenyl-4-hydroxybenzoate carboxy-lyase [Fusarium bulbicola]
MEAAPESPMAEYHGHIFPGESHDCPLFRVNAITHRTDPILPVCVAGRAPGETHTVWELMQAAEILTICQDAGLPITMAWSPFESHCLWFVLQLDMKKIRDMNTKMKKFSERVGHTIFGSKPGFYIPTIYLVGDDIDPTNLKDVIWADATRYQPKAHEFFFDQYPSIGLIPFVSHGYKEGKHHYKTVRCCIFPGAFSQDVFWGEASFEGNYSKEIQAKVLKDWATYGF